MCPAKLVRRFTFLCSDGERDMILALAQHMDRTQSDAIRVILRMAVKEAQKVTGNSIPKEDGLEIVPQIGQ